MFKDRAKARRALLDTRFPTRAAGLVALSVDYDPAIWLRAPVTGDDRTEWHDRALAALAQDWGLPAGGEAHQLYDRVLDRVADDPLSHDATFLSLLSPGESPSTVALDVADEELTLLEHGDPDRWLAFEDLDGSPGSVLPMRHSEAVPGSELRQTTRTADEGTTLLRAHRRLAIDPVLHLSAFGFLNGPKLSKRLLSAGLLVRSVRGVTADGRLL